MSNFEDRSVDLTHYIPFKTIKELPPLAAVTDISYDNRLVLVHLYVTNVCDWYIIAGEPVVPYFVHNKYYHGLVNNDYRLYGIHQAKTVKQDCVYLSSLNLLRHPETNNLLVFEDHNWRPKLVSELEL